MSRTEQLMVAGWVVAFGLLFAGGVMLGMGLKGGEITHLKLTNAGLEITVEQQRVGLEGLGRVIQSTQRRETTP